VLVQFAFIVFALFAVLSLIIDVGYARLTQVQMQNAADTAALEGLRNRDLPVVNAATGQPVLDAFASDCLRRTAANHLVRWMFDDDFDTVTGDSDYQFGAGPVINLTGGTTNLHANQTLSTPDGEPVYKPDLQLNQQNAVYGDMVSGRFCYNAATGPSEGLAFDDPEALVCLEPQRASGVYARNDFNPNGTAPQPPPTLSSCPPADEAAPDPWPLPGSGSLTSVEDSAFLVRLRRSNEFRDSDVQIESDVASSGSSLPLVFGRGTTILGDDSTDAYSPRRDGLTVRATAIAEVRPALHIGLPQAIPFRRGVTSFALVDTFVATLSAVGTPATINPANGLICQGLTCAGVTPATAVGRFVAGSTLINTVGDPLPGPAAVACTAVNAAGGYGAVSSVMISSGTTRIIGFARLALSQDPGRSANPCAVLVTHGVSLVATANATAVLPGGLPLPASATSAEVSELMRKNLVQGAANYGPVLAPVVAR